MAFAGTSSWPAAGSRAAAPPFCEADPLFSAPFAPCLGAGAAFSAEADCLEPVDAGDDAEAVSAALTLAPPPDGPAALPPLPPAEPDTPLPADPASPVLAEPPPTPVP